MQRSSTLSAKIRSAIFEEGRAAGESGHSVVSNPYLHDDTDERLICWVNGYLLGRRGSAIL